MVDFLRRKFIKNYEDVTNQKVRDAHGKLACVGGIISNLVLFIMKFTIGLLTGSVSIVGDSVNNISDMGSSVVTLIGFKMSNAPADKEHPYGHERIEYIAGLIVSIIILVVGFQLLMQSVTAIKDNTKSELSIVAFIILGISIIIKLLQGLFYKQIGKKINSVALEATAADSINDVVSTSVILIGSLIIYFFPNIPFSLDGVLGILVAIFILISGIKMVKETVDPLIGVTPDHEYIQNILNDIKKYKVVLGVHDVRCHMYGPTKSFMTLHVEVDSSKDLLLIHDEIDNIEREIGNKYQLELTIHMDPIDINDKYSLELKAKLTILMDELNLHFHDFRIVKGDSHTNVLFDVVVPFKYKLTEEEIKTKVEEYFKDNKQKLYFIINFDGEYID